MNQNDIENEGSETISIAKKEGLTKKDILTLFKNKHGNTPLHEAATLTYNPNIIALLLESGANKNIKCDDNNETALEKVKIVLDVLKEAKGSPLLIDKLKKMIKILKEQP